MQIPAPVAIDQSNVAEELPRYQAWAVQILRRHCCPDPENAAGDVTCIVLTQVMEKGETLRDPAAYIAKVCFNIARERKRKRTNLEQQMPETIQLMTPAPNYNLVLDIEAAITKLELNREDRELLREAEAPRKELAAHFGTTVDALTKRLERLRRKLSSALAEVDRQPAGINKKNET
jgi:hypothetical protein